MHMPVAWDPRAHRMLYLPPKTSWAVEFIERVGVKRLKQESRDHPQLIQWLEEVT